ncbi:MAG: hypothetical protein IE918_09765 [Campylobacterales bacterium]|nr:hypothetical protein [Campylobacterales bacterium]
MKTTVKTILILSTLIGTLSAQPFHQYKVKSGKIVYEHKKFIVKNNIKITNGTEEFVREVIPYTAMRTTYYWDNYGDIAYEEAWRVSTGLNETLPEPKKEYEMLWKDNARYYYKVSKNKVSRDDWYERKLCEPMASKLDDRGCFGVLYPQMTDGGEALIAGNATHTYVNGINADLFLWKGLKLKELNYSTNNSGTERYDLNNETVAVKIDTNSTIDPTLFSPAWLEGKH